MLITNNNFRLRADAVKPTHFDRLERVATEYEGLLEIDPFYLMKECAGLTTEDIYRLTREQFPENNNPRLYKQFVGPCGLRSSLDVLCARIRAAMED